MKRKKGVANKSLSIAICGLDGAGKSTLIANLRSLGSFHDSRVFKKENRDNVKRLQRLSTECSKVPSCFLEGACALNLRWAVVLDFFQYYSWQVLPNLRRGVPVIFDRWTPCMHAWCEMIRPRDPAITQLLDTVYRPDIIFYLDVSVEQALQRIHTRGDRKDDEDEAILTRFRQAYEGVLPRFESTLIRVPALSKTETAMLVADKLERIAGCEVPDITSLGSF